MTPGTAPVTLVCPDHGVALLGAESVYGCPRGCAFPVVGGIPRFVPGDTYARSFGLQWSRFHRAQLDSYTGYPESRYRLERCLGGDLESMRGSLVLEAGCGAGRFTEVLLAEGARVVSTDLAGGAIEANAANHAGREGFFPFHADLLRLPFVEESFDVVLCLGVVQHTPSPEDTMAKLARMVRPGGILVLDHYPRDLRWNTPLNRTLRRFVLKLPQRWRSPFVFGLVHLLWPVHRLTRHSARVTRFSPVLDFRRTRPWLTPRMLKEWALMNTHDGLTDVYKHTRSPEEIEAVLKSLDFEVLDVHPGGNGVEARARKPRIGALRSGTQGSESDS